MRFQSFSLASSVAALLVLSAGCQGREAPREDETGLAEDCSAGECPNILLIIADDLGWNDVGYHGSWIETPNIDRLVGDGVELERFYVDPISDVARAALMSGRSAIHFGTQYSQGTLPAEEYTIAERFHDAGYQTALIGKWSLSPVREGDNSPKHPNAQGFDYFYGHLGGMIFYFAKSFLQGRDWWRNGELLDEGGYSTTLLGLDAVRFLQERDPDRPFFLALSFNAPHSPIEIPAWARDKYYDEFCLLDRCGTRCELLGETDSRCDYARVVELMDDHIGTVLAVLESEGIAEDTIVVFMSDNGADPRFSGSNAPLFGQKDTTFEGGIRVPAAIRWTGVLTAGFSSAQFIRQYDLFPTLEAAADLKLRAPSPDGMNVWPILMGAPERDREFFFAIDVLGTASTVERWGVTHHAMIDGPWKLVTQDRDDGAGNLVRELHLFNIIDDPLENNDLAEDFPAFAAELNEEIERWAAQYPDDGVRSPLYNERYARRAEDG